jgi:hypothetical protein
MVAASGEPPESTMRAYSTIERAFEIARSPDCTSLDELRSKLTHEGYTDAVAQTSFPFVRKQLQDLMQGRAPSAPRKAERSRKRAVLGLSFEHPIRTGESSF